MQRRACAPVSRSARAHRSPYAALVRMAAAWVSLPSVRAPVSRYRFAVSGSVAEAVAAVLHVPSPFRAPPRPALPPALVPALLRLLLRGLCFCSLLLSLFGLLRAVCFCGLLFLLLSLFGLLRAVCFCGLLFLLLSLFGLLRALCLCGLCSCSCPSLGSSAPCASAVSCSWSCCPSSDSSAPCASAGSCSPSCSEVQRLSSRQSRALPRGAPRSGRRSAEGSPFSPSERDACAFTSFRAAHRGPSFDKRTSGLRVRVRGPCRLRDG